jgi:hypothetical protein
MTNYENRQSTIVMPIVMRWIDPTGDRSAPMSPAETLEDRPDTRTRILDVADRLFRHYGYAKTTVADLARELEIGRASCRERVS